MNSVALALDGLEEGYRVIANRLNRVLAIHCPELRIECNALRKGDSISSARSKLRRALPNVPLEDGIDTARWGAYSPWTLGHINGLENEPANIALVELYQGEVFGGISFLLNSVDWTHDQWQKCIVQHVEQHHAAWTSLLLGWSEWMPKNMVAKSCGEGGWKTLKKKSIEGTSLHVVEWNDLNNKEARYRLRAPKKK